MKRWSVATWLDVLKRLQAQFHEASQRGTVPRVCWFRFSFPQEITLRDATETAEHFLLQFGTNAKVERFLVHKGDGTRRWWCAVLDCDAKDLSLFMELADQSFSAAHWGLRHAVGTVPEIMPDMSTDGYISEDNFKYMNWVCTAANIRRFHPDPMLALTHFEGGQYSDADCALASITGFANARGPLSGEFVQEFPIELIGEFTKLDYAQLMKSWDGPFVQGSFLRHDVWRFSVAALDHLIEAATAAPLPAATANAARDEWLYKQCLNLNKSLATILRELANNTNGWEPLESIQGVRMAAIRYAKHHGLPKIPSRQPGRPTRKK